MSPSFIIHCVITESNNFFIKNSDFKVDLFKDYYVQDNLLSNLKTNNKLINVLAGIYSNENNLDNLNNAYDDPHLGNGLLQELIK